MLYVAKSFEIEFKEFYSPAAYVVPFRRVWRDLVTVPVKVNGKTTSLLLDTGAPVSALTAAAWKRVGLPNLPSAQVSIQCGQHSAQAACTPLVAELEKSFATFSGEIDGILGLDALAGCAVGLDLPSEVVALFPPSVDFARRHRMWFDSMALPGAAEPTWIPWCSSPSLLSERHADSVQARPEPGAAVVDTLMIGDRICLPVSFQDVVLDCLVDTGSATTALPVHPFGEILPRGEGAHLRMAPPRAVKVSGFDWTHLETVAVHLAKNGDGSLGILGMNVLALSKVLFDFRERRISFAPYGKPREESESLRYHKAVIFDMKEKRILHFQGKARYVIHSGSVVLAGRSRVKVVGSQGDMVTIDVA